MGIAIAAANVTMETEVRSAGFAIDDQAPVAMGRADAFAAQADDPSALHYNPAGIGQLSGSQASLGPVLIVPSMSFDSDVTGRSTESKSSPFLQPAIFLTQEVSPAVHAGIGITVPFGLSTDWPKDWEGRYVATFSEISFLQINPNVAWSPSDNIHLAAGISAVRAGVTLKRRLESPPPAPDGDLKMDADSYGFGYNLAMLTRLPFDFQAGISFRSPIRIRFDGDADFSFPDPSMNFSTGADSTLRLPPTVVVGMANQTLSETTIEVDVQWTGWSTIRALKIDFDSPAVPDSDIPKDWKNSMTYKFGVEHRFDPFAVRAGYSLDITPVPSKTLDPTLPDSTRDSFSTGASVAFGKARIDFAYVLVLFRDRNADTQLPTGGTPFDQNGTYSATVHDIGVSLVYVLN